MITKNYKVLISKTVKDILLKQADYIANQQQEPILALKWFEGIESAINSLRNFPERCPIAPENYYIKQNSKIVIRHLIYKKSSRVVFVIIKNEVRILNVKHSAMLVKSI